MKVDFEWREAEDAPDEDVANGEGAGLPQRRLLALLIIVGIVALALLSQLRQRVEGQEQALQEEIIASFHLWHQAVHTNDLELFRFQLAEGNAAWKETQAQLFEQRRLLDRRAFGLHYEAQAGGPQITTVQLSPDWQAATLAVRYPYILAQSGEHTSLEATYHFQRQDGHWLLAAPGADFWGSEQTLQRPGLTIVYPQRDAETVRRLADDLAEEMVAICREYRPQDDRCLDTNSVNVGFETDPVLLQAHYDRLTTILGRGEFLLPAPTLVGLPQDEATYRALYSGYSSRLLKAVATNVRPLDSLPEQDLALLCFPDRGQPLYLYRYEVAAERWTNELADYDFRSLLHVPGGDGVILQTVPSREEASRLSLWHWRGDDLRLVLDEVVSEQVKPPAGWANSAQPRLLVHNLQEDLSHQYHWLDLEQCDASGCRLRRLSGYTTWSPYGTHTLTQEGENLWRGDHLGERVVPLGTAQAPFWLDNERYGYVRYDRDAGAPSMQVVTATVGIDLPHIVLPVQVLAQALAVQAPDAETRDIQAAPLTFINYVSANPADSDLLLLWATSVGALEGTHSIFSYRLSTGELRLVAQFEQLPRGDPSRLTPAGYPPFRISPDGRWLLVTVLERLPATAWEFQLYDLQQEQNQAFSASYPDYPTPFPIYDWTADGRWLAVVEDGYLYLTAPGMGHERIIPYRFENCLYAAWMRP